jgi:hypothetical protein
VADAFQDSEYFLPKIALQDQLGLDVEVISLKRDPIEIYSNFSRIGLLDVSKTIPRAAPAQDAHRSWGVKGSGWPLSKKFKAFRVEGPKTQGS